MKMVAQSLQSLATEGSVLPRQSISLLVLIFGKSKLIDMSLGGGIGEERGECLEERRREEAIRAKERYFYPLNLQKKKNFLSAL